MSEFKKGDVVQLKSGGPRMTVSAIVQQQGEERIWCVWFDGSKKTELPFDQDTLQKVATGIGIAVI